MKMSEKWRDTSGKGLLLREIDPDTAAYIREREEMIVENLRPAIMRIVDDRVEEWLTHRRDNNPVMVSTQKLAEILGYTAQGILKKRKEGEIRAVPTSDGAYMYDVRRLLREVNQSNWRNPVAVEMALKVHLMNADL